MEWMNEWNKMRNWRPNDDNLTAPTEEGAADGRDADPVRRSGDVAGSVGRRSPGQRPAVRRLSVGRRAPATGRPDPDVVDVDVLHPGVGPHAPRNDPHLFLEEPLYSFREVPEEPTSWLLLSIRWSICRLAIAGFTGLIWLTSKWINNYLWEKKDLL